MIRDTYQDMLQRQQLKPDTAQAEVVAGELVFRVTAELGDEVAQQLVERTGLQSWNMQLPRARIAQEHSIGLGRRRALSRLARDVERGLGRITCRTSDEALETLLGPLLVDSEAPQDPLQSAGA